jgi:hypothetical protein
MFSPVSLGSKMLLLEALLLLFSSAFLSLLFLINVCENATLNPHAIFLIPFL